MDKIEEKMLEFTDKLTEASEQELLALAEEIDVLLLKEQGDWTNKVPAPTTARMLKRLGAKNFKALLEARLRAPAVRSALASANEELQASLNAEFLVEPGTQIEELLQAIKDGKVGPPTPSSPLTVESIDITGWDEFYPRLFEGPTLPSTLGQYDFDLVNGIQVRKVFPCAYLSFKSTDKNKAIQALRTELHRMLEAGVVFTGFLAKPSTIELVRRANPDETPDTSVVFDLEGHKPGKRAWAAFCFVHGYLAKALDPDTLRALGISGVVNEGEVGSEIK